VFAFDLNAEAARLQREIPAGVGRASKSLVKYSDFRLVLIAMMAGARMEEHSTPARISVETLSGHLLMHVREKLFDLPQGQILVLESDIPHDVEALADSTFLLTFAWPGSKA
jgi:quercetin dioxygenase-like cupin family protein